MSGPVEVRHFLLQQESIDPGSSFTGGVPTQRTGETARVTEEQVRRAQLAVARGALGVEDCRELSHDAYGQSGDLARDPRAGAVPGTRRSLNW